MKSPAEIAQKLAKQWENTSLREPRVLLGEKMPILMPIGKPTSTFVRDNNLEFVSHLNAWKKVTVGTVITKPATYRSHGQPVDLPTHWKISTLEEWIKACNSSHVRNEYEMLQEILENSEPLFHSYLVRKLSHWKNKPTSEIRQALKLALLLTPNIADGAPMRTLSLANIDTKFIERHYQLVSALLDIRYDGKITELGLENFLGAWHNNDHWILLADLDGKLLPFAQQRVRASELHRLSNIGASHILIVENEQCLQQLPELPSTLAILGCGLNLSWMNNAWLNQRSVAYWGDLDTWGLTMLSKARSAVPMLTPLLMTQEIFDQHLSKCVTEPTPSSEQPPTALTIPEQTLYCSLLKQKIGRLEQEFLDSTQIHRCVHHWLNKKI